MRILKLPFGQHDRPDLEINFERSKISKITQKMTKLQNIFSDVFQKKSNLYVDIYIYIHTDIYIYTFFIDFDVLALARLLMSSV